MIAVEWLHQFNNGTEEVRTGVLLSTGHGTDDSTRYSSHAQHEVAHVITKRDARDPFVKGHERPDGDYPKIIISVKLSRLIVKGVHIPFEPHGAEK